MVQMIRMLHSSSSSGLPHPDSGSFIARIRPFACAFADHPFFCFAVRSQMPGTGDFLAKS
jgi:hypothetical protein